MTQYIDKDKVLAEIEKRMKRYKKCGGLFTGCIGPSASAVEYYYRECKEIFDLIAYIPQEESVSIKSEPSLLEQARKNCPYGVKKDVKAGSDDLEKAADKYGEQHLTYKDDEGCWIDTQGPTTDAFKAGAEWQKKQDIRSWDSRTATFDPDVKPSEDDKKAALSYAYDLDAYIEGSGVHINDVVMGFYGGLRWQKAQDQKDLERLKKSWYEEGRIDGKYEGLSDDEKYHQGLHDGQERMMKDAIHCNVFWYDGPLLDYTREQQDGALEKIGAKVGDEVKVIIVKE